jgi:hypothetical protein
VNTPAPVGSNRPARSPAFYILIAMGVGCGAALILFAALAAVMLPVFVQAREKARTVTCLSNVKLQQLAMRMYVQDYDETMPPAAGWMDKLTPYVRSETFFHCPSVGRAASGAYGYAYNRSLEGAKMADIPQPRETIALYDSTNLSRSASDRLTSLPRPGRHHDPKPGNVVSYMDGHTRYVAD